MPAAVVTGAARGIGAAVAHSLAADGWQLVLVDRVRDDPALGYPLATPAELAAVAERTSGVPVEADVRDQEALTRACQLAAQRFGGLDAAIAVAGVMAGGPPAWQVDDESWQVLFDVNLRGVLHLARAAVPLLLRRPSGRFVAVASAAGTRPLPRLAGYVAAKHAVVGYVRTLAADLAGDAVTANVVCPGSTDTAMLAATAPVYEVSSPSVFAEHSRLGRLLAPSEVASAVAWLCSPAASGVTGSVVPVDGGFTG